MSGATTYDPFETDWRACLEAHLRYVITTGDTINEVSLIDVLRASGFTDEDITRVRYEVTGEAPIAEPDEPTAEEPISTAAETVVEVVEQPVAAEPAAEPPPSSVEPEPLEPIVASVEADTVEAISEPEPNAEIEEVVVSPAASKDAETPPPMQLSLF